MPPKFKNKIDEETIKKVVDTTLSYHTESDKKQAARDKIEKIKQYIEKKKEKNETDCPTCHKHKLKVDNSQAKCTGKDCSHEYLIIDKNSKHACDNCGLPHPDGVEDCPFCHSTEGKILEKTWGQEIEDAKTNK